MFLLVCFPINFLTCILFLMCPLEDEFNEVEMFNIDTMIENADNAFPFLCVSSSLDLKRAYRRSTEEGTFECPNGCGRMYHLKNSLYKHLKFDCGVEKQFECQVCGKQFSRKTSMRNHLFLVHKIVGI